MFCNGDPNYQSLVLATIGIIQCIGCKGPRMGIHQRLKTETAPNRQL